MRSLKRMSRSILRKFISLQIHHISDRISQEERKYFFVHGVTGFCNEFVTICFPLYSADTFLCQVLLLTLGRQCQAWFSPLSCGNNGELPEPFFLNMQNKEQQSLLGDFQLECRQCFFYSLEPGSPASTLTRLHRVGWAAGSISETWNLGDRFLSRIC